MISKDKGTMNTTGKYDMLTSEMNQKCQDQKQVYHDDEFKLVKIWLILK